MFSFLFLSLFDLERVSIVGRHGDVVFMGIGRLVMDGIGDLSDLASLAWLGLAWLILHLHCIINSRIFCIALHCKEREREGAKRKEFFSFFFLYRLHKLFCWGYLALGWCGKGMRKEGVE